MTNNVRINRINDGTVAEIVIDTPDEQNTLDEETAIDFKSAVSQVNGSDSSVAIVRGDAETFSAGGDLTQTPEEFVRGIDLMIDAIVRIYTADIPYIAAIRGSAIGGGFELAMACDLRITGTEALLALPEVTLGIFPPSGAVRFLSHVAGRAVALELCLTGRRITGEEAANLGVVTQAVPDGEVYESARAMATELSNHSVDSMAAIKQSVNASFPRPIDEAKWDLETARWLALKGDFQREKRNFLEEK